MVDRGPRPRPPRATIHRRTRTIVVLAALALTCATAACGSRDPDPATATTTGPDVLTPTLTVPGSPAAQVTDVYGLQLTGEQAAKVKELCRDSAGVPGTTEDCLTLLRDIDVELCLTTSTFCVFGAHVAGRPDVGVLQLVDNRPGSPACGAGGADLCQGVVVDGDVIAPLARASTAGPTRTTGTTGSPPPSGTGVAPNSETANPTPTTAKPTLPPTAPSKT